MKNTQHTRGPWKVRGGNVIESFSNVNVAKAWMTDQKEECANAHLIAAAPDLLDLLEAAVARVQIANEEGNPILSAWLPEALSTLLKAKGEA